MLDWIVGLEWYWVGAVVVGIAVAIWYFFVK